MIKSSFAKQIGLSIHLVSQTARQADSVTPLKIHGEVHCQFTRDDHIFNLDALVVDRLDTDILTGTLFLTSLDKALQTAKKQITIRGGDSIT